MKKQNAKIDKVLKKAVEHMVDTELYGWPPQCPTFLYQPIRPKKKKEGINVVSGNLHK